MIACRPGDVILVRRRLRWRDWLFSPLSCFVSWRIQRSSGSPWNHVACYLGGADEIAEAEWNRGVRVGHLREYSRSSAYELAIARLPEGSDCWAAVRFWREEAARPDAEYDLRSVLLLRVAAALYGPDKIDEVIRGTPGDHAWICSELAAEGWRRAGVEWARRELVAPGNFAEDPVKVDRMDGHGG